jgi:hypothetical protein
MILPCGFDLHLDAAFSPADDSGYVSARFDQLDSGFEFSISSVTDGAPGYLQLATSQADTSSVCANFYWGGDLVEMCCASAAAASLTALTGGVLYDPQEHQAYAGPAAIALAKGWIVEAAS